MEMPDHDSKVGPAEDVGGIASMPRKEPVSGQDELIVVLANPIKTTLAGSSLELQFSPFVLIVGQNLSLIEH
jgi:hypothetical protein